MVSINNSINNTVGGSNSGQTNTLLVTNSSDTASSQANILVNVGGTSAGDPSTTYFIAHSTSWSQGIDNSDSDRFKVSLGNDLGTTDALAIDTTLGVQVVGGNFNVVRSASGSAVASQVTNNSNTASSDARSVIMVAGTSAGDPYTIYTVTGGSSWAAGIDNSDGDSWKLSLGGVLGTNDAIVVTTTAVAGDVNIALHNLFVFRSDPGNNVSATIQNTSNTASSQALHQIVVAGDSAGDAYSLYALNAGAGTQWTTGLDNSDSDSYKISLGSALGTSDCVTIDTAGVVRIPKGDFGVGRSSVGGSVISSVSNTDNTNVASSANQILQVGGTSAGDPITTYSVSGSNAWNIGLDNSDSDKFKIAVNSGLGGGDTLSITTGGQVTLPQQVSFTAYNNTNLANVTGDGTVYTVIFNQFTQVGSSYNAATGIFTALVDGWYQFSGSVLIANIGAGHTFGRVSLLAGGNSYYGSYLSPAAVRTNGNACNLAFAVKVYMTATQTAQVQVDVDASTKTISVGGAAAPDIFTYFSGGLTN